jgi:hypothetical protein
VKECLVQYIFQKEKCGFRKLKECLKIKIGINFVFVMLNAVGEENGRKQFFQETIPHL